MNLSIMSLEIHGTFHLLKEVSREKKLSKLVSIIAMD